MILIYPNVRFKDQPDGRSERILHKKFLSIG